MHTALPLFFWSSCRAVFLPLSLSRPPPVSASFALAGKRERATNTHTHRERERGERDSDRKRLSRARAERWRGVSVSLCLSLSLSLSTSLARALSPPSLSRSLPCFSRLLYFFLSFVSTLALSLSRALCSPSSLACFSCVRALLFCLAGSSCSASLCRDPCADTRMQVALLWPVVACMALGGLHLQPAHGQCCIRAVHRLLRRTRWCNNAWGKVSHVDNGSVLLIKI